MELWNITIVYIKRIYQIFHQWISKEFRKILQKCSEVLHANPIHEVVKSNSGECVQWHHVVGILIFHIDLVQAVVNLVSQ